MFSRLCRLFGRSRAATEFSASIVAQLDLIEPKTLSRPFEVVADVRTLAVKFVWFDDKTLNVGRNKNDADYIGCDRKRDRDQQQD